MTRRLSLQRVRTFLGPDAAAVRQSLVALCLQSSASITAGVFLGSIIDTLERFPGLLVLVPAVSGLRGNIFGSFGNRVSTSIHAGTFSLSGRRDTVLGQNIQASMLLMLSLSLLLAVVAKTYAVALRVEGSIGLLDLITISIAGGLLASVVVLVLTVGVAAGGTRYGWDLDSVSAPVVSGLGDVVTLPAIWLATFVLGYRFFTPTLGSALVVMALVATVIGWRSRLPDLRRIVRESLPILLLAGTLSAAAGIALERSLTHFTAFPALLMLAPAHASTAGGLGGILSGRLSTKLLLGLTQPSATPGREARRDIGLLVLVAIPIYLLNASGVALAATLIDARTPGLGRLMGVSLLAGGASLFFVMTIAYYATVAANRTGLDPDNYGIPAVTGCMDFLGSLTLVTAIAVLGIG